MSLILALATLLQDANLDEPYAGHIRMLKQAGDSLITILDDILDLSRIEAGHLHPEQFEIHLPDKLDLIRQLWATKAEEQGLYLHAHIAEGTPLDVLGDPVRLRQVLLNLVSNAVKFTKSGGVTIEARLVDKASDKPMLRFEVRDTGIGIPQERHGQVFETFRQADSSISRQYGGTGLGLSICKRLVGAMDGQIGLVSAPNEGSTFWFTLPCRINTRRSGPPRTIPPSKLPPLRLLLAEDNPLNQRVTQLLLARGGHHVDIVGTGTSAVDAVSHTAYNAVLMDIHMPEMDGLTAAMHIRKLPHPANLIPIIGLSADAMVGTQERYLASGLNDYIPKPVNIAQLNASLQRLCCPPTEEPPPEPGEAPPEQASPLKATSSPPAVTLLRHERWRRSSSVMRRRRPRSEMRSLAAVAGIEPASASAASMVDASRSRGRTMPWRFSQRSSVA